MIEIHGLRTDGQITYKWTATNTINSGHRVVYEGFSMVALLFFNLRIELKLNWIEVRTLYERLAARHGRNNEYLLIEALKQNERLPIIFLNM